MSEIMPFSGVRFADGSITKYICPPYDVISDKEREWLIKLSQFNMVSIELPKDAKNKGKYDVAAEFFDKWLKNKVLSKDSSRSIYFYEQSFKDHGKKMVRRGFFAAMRLEDPFKGSVKPHEKTLAKPKEDRLNLLRAVKANLSPIFGLFDDKKSILTKYSAALSKKKEDARAVDPEGTVHRLWRIDDPAVIKKVQSVLRSSEVFIADGHHRYETAWNYLNETNLKGGKIAKNAAINNVLIFLCAMQDKGLSVWPTHRVFTAPADIEEKIKERFIVLPKEKFKANSNKSPQPIMIYKDGKYRTLIVKNKKILDGAMKGRCVAYKNLGVSILHSLLLEDVKPEDITYYKDEKLACVSAKQSGKAAVMVPATPVKAIKDIAEIGQTMPQKSTYFFPKVATGIVIHSVRGEE